VKIANLDSRPHLVSDDGTSLIDAADAVGTEFSTFGAVYSGWEEFRRRAAEVDLAGATTVPLDRRRLGSPSPAPRQIVAIGLNYRAHAAESGFSVPETLPPVFTKFVTSLSGPDTEVELPEGGNTDWEVELVVVIGRGGRDIPEADAWSHVAGLAVGQDISERVSQLQGPAPQFSLGKSFAGFAPIGPWLVTPDEFEDPDDIALGCAIDGETVQSGRTSDLLFPVPSLISRISGTIELLPGDILFTGTPAGVGVGRDPQRFLQPGEVLTTWAEGIGGLRQSFITGGTK
jgi:2-keto-4-pentenoate hydratase/2-oxohepta-3-ene-1,7-dioic acid hydratase in catechol pathway